MSEKRKTTTSTAVKRRYNSKTYTQFRADLRNEDYAEINEYIQSRGWSKAEFIKRAYAEMTKETDENKPIYTVLSGTYSDTRIVGYTSTPEEAYKYCAWANLRNEYDDKHHVEEIECLNNPVKDISFMYEYTAEFVHWEDGWELLKGCDFFSTHSMIAEPYCKISEDYSGRVISIKFTTDYFSFERAKKVAQDKLYEYLAQKQNL